MDLNDDGGAVGSVADILGGGDEVSAPGDAGGEQDAGVGGSGAEQQQGEPDFYGLLSAEVGEGESASNRDVVKAKGWKSIDDVVKGYRSAERALRDGGRVKPPTEGASDDEIAAYHRAIGVPEKVDGYSVPEVKGADGNPVPLNTPFVDRVLASALKHGAPKSAIDAILKDEIEAQVAEHDAQIAAVTKAAGDHVKSWGADKDARLAQVNAAAKDAGLSQQDMSYLRGMPSGPGKMLDMLAKMGSHFSEDSLVGGDRKAFGMDATTAQAELDAIKADRELAAKARVPGTAENARWTRAMNAVKAAAGSQPVEN